MLRKYRYDQSDYPTRGSNALTMPTSQAPTSPRASPGRHLLATPSIHTLPQRPWRKYSTPFPRILAQIYPGSGTPEDPYLIDWLPGRDDPENPLKWAEGYKWAIMAIATWATLGVALASSALSAAERSVAESFPDYDREVYTMGELLEVLEISVGRC